MARETPPDRIAELVRCAAQVFIAQGYRRTQMADIAAALGRGGGMKRVERRHESFEVGADGGSAADRRGPRATNTGPAHPMLAPAPGSPAVTRH